MSPEEWDEFFAREVAKLPPPTPAVREWLLDLARAHARERLKEAS